LSLPLAAGLPPLKRHRTAQGGRDTPRRLRGAERYKKTHTSVFAFFTSPAAVLAAPPAGCRSGA
jgi:hypothetical protein